MVHRADAPHIGTSYSMSDILAVLYGTVLRLDPARPDWPDRDRFIISKGHGAAAIYAALAARGFFPTEWLETYCGNGARPAGHIVHHGVPGVDDSTDSLGHGLSLAPGIAPVGRHEDPNRVFAVLGDGECDESSI
jgi:transketolase